MDERTKIMQALALNILQPCGASCSLGQFTVACRNAQTKLMSLYKRYEIKNSNET